MLPRAVRRTTGGPYHAHFHASGVAHIVCIDPLELGPAAAGRALATRRYVRWELAGRAEEFAPYRTVDHRDLLRWSTDRARFFTDLLARP